MPFTIESRHFGDSVAIIKAKVFGDERGFFLEAYRADQMSALGLPHEYVQDNHSGSVKGVVRGLHFQWDPEIAKLMRVTVGTAFLVAVDIRKGSPTLGQWVGIEASAQNSLQMFAPAGFARGFCVLSDFAEIQYKCTGLYNPKGESGILWNDKHIGIDWPVDNPILSEKDRHALTLSEWLARPESDHFTYLG
ncbi:MAG: dTDP-4-dehydrorhamnose 3,5-epimerase [Candidatus Latescibacterota bacterium]